MGVLSFTGGSLCTSECADLSTWHLGGHDESSTRSMACFSRRPLDSSALVASGVPRSLQSQRLSAIRALVMRSLSWSRVAIVPPSCLLRTQIAVISQGVHLYLTKPIWSAFSLNACLQSMMSYFLMRPRLRRVILQARESLQFLRG